MRNLIAPVLTDNLTRLAASYLEAVQPTNPNMSLKRLSRLAHGDWPFFEALAAGKCGVTLRKYDEIIKWFDDEAKWPKGWKRPELNDPRHGKSTKARKATNDGETQGRSGNRGGKAKGKTKPVRTGE